MSAARATASGGTPKRRRPRRRSRSALRIPWRPILWTTGVLACGLGALGASWWALPQLWQAARTHPYFAVSELTVRGNARVSREQLVRWAGVYPGISIWDADPVTVSTRLLQHPDLATARVRRDFPRRLVITVRERTAMAIAVLDDLYFVDRAGRLMDRLRARDSRDLPMITGPSLADLNERAGGALLRRAVRVIRLCQREGCGTGLSEVHVDARRGVTLIPVHQSAPIVLGWGGWRTKLAHTTRVLAALEGQESRVAVFDASFPGQVVVRLRPAPAKSHPVMHPTMRLTRHGARSGMRA